MMIKLCPGWVCQPELPPGCHVLLCTYRSDGPLVFCKDIQTLPGKPEGRSLFENWLKTSNSLKVPTAIVVLWFAKTSAETQNGAVLGGVGRSVRYSKKTLEGPTRVRVGRTYIKDRSKIDPGYAARL